MQAKRQKVLQPPQPATTPRQLVSNPAAPRPAATLQTTSTAQQSTQDTVLVRLTSGQVVRVPRSILKKVATFRQPQVPAPTPVAAVKQQGPRPTPHQSRPLIQPSPQLHQAMPAAQQPQRLILTRPPSHIRPPQIRPPQQLQLIGPLIPTPLPLTPALSLASSSHLTTTSTAGGVVTTTGHPTLTPAMPMEGKLSDLLTKISPDGGPSQSPGQSREKKLSNYHSLFISMTSSTKVSI